MAAQMWFNVVFALLWAFISLEAKQTTFQTDVRIDEPRWGWMSCGYDDDPMLIRSIEISPDPPQRGENLTITMKGAARTFIEEGAYADVTLRVGRIQILEREIDLCREARSSEMSISCPVEPGEHEVVHTVSLPLNIPPAKYIADVRVYTMDDDDLTCLDVWVDFTLRGRL